MLVGTRRSSSRVVTYIDQQAASIVARAIIYYDVVRPVGEVDYFINMHNRWNNRQVFHVNMLKQFRIALLLWIQVSFISGWQSRDQCGKKATR